MSIEREQTIEHDPYASVREKQARERPIDQSETQRFYRLLTQGVLHAALPGSACPRVIVQEFRRAIEQHGVFTFQIEGEAILKNCDLILANHQGPHADEEGVGGSECLFAQQMLRPGTRCVLRHELIELPSWSNRMLYAKRVLDAPWRTIKQIVKALAFRKTHPIAVNRRATRPVWNEETIAAPRRENYPEDIRRSPAFEAYITQMRTERRRVGNAICDAANIHTPVILYPEGTRSEDGRILGFVSEYFESIVDNYLLRHLDDPADIHIGLLVADTLSTFPHGIGKNVEAYNHPIRLKGVRYDPTNIVSAMQGILKKKKPSALNPQKMFAHEERKALGRSLLIDIRHHMAKTLAEILPA